MRKQPRNLALRYTFDDDGDSCNLELYTSACNTFWWCTAEHYFYFRFKILINFLSGFRFFSLLFGHLHPSLIPCLHYGCNYTLKSFNMDRNWTQSNDIWLLFSFFFFFGVLDQYHFHNLFCVDCYWVTITNGIFSFVFYWLQKNLEGVLHFEFRKLSNFNIELFLILCDMNELDSIPNLSFSFVLLSHVHT